MDLIFFMLVLILTGNGVLSQSTTVSTVTAADTTVDLLSTTAASDVTTQSPASVTDVTTNSAVTTPASPESTTVSRNLVVSTETQGIQTGSTTGPFFNQPVYTVPTAAPPRAQQPAQIYYTYPYTQQYRQVYQPQPGYNNIPYYYQPAPKPVQYYRPTSFYQQRDYYRRQSYQQPNNLFNMFYMMMFDLF